VSGLETTATLHTQEPSRSNLRSPATIVPAAEGDARIGMSLVIPAYNEEARLPDTIARTIEYLSGLGGSWEILICDDGSDDGTPAIAERAAEQCERLRHLRLPHAGKAVAVRTGVLSARGEAIVFTDADLATPIEYVRDARDLLEEGWDLVIGSREGNGARRIGEPRHRHYMGRLYNYFVQALLLPGIRDTQCGFKAFRYDVARDLFTRTALYHGTDLRVRGPLVTGFDVELLYLARRRGYRIFELPVVWRHVSGSKVRPGVDSMLMLRDVLRVRWNGLRGRYD
jgi:dolichyl-phosphate beta-glucosyltransferase